MHNRKTSHSTWILILISLLLFSYATPFHPTRYPKARTHKFPDLLSASIDDLVEGLNCKHFTSVDLVRAYSLRIIETNQTFRAVTEINPDALAIAAQLDAERAAGNIRGPLHGLPILLKNNIATADKLGNTVGSFALLGATVPRDAGVAARLRSAGVIILGKSNISQWANFRSLNSTNGWSALGGQTTGAYFPNQDPSGSSSGSGVASSVGLAVAAIGSETSGSILSPSSVNNLVGIKPTVGLVSRSLVVPISQRQDTIGPMARSVKDAAYILSAIAGQDPYDNYTSAIPFETIPDYVAALDINAFQGKRIGIPRNLISEQPGLDHILQAFSQAIDLITEAGATIFDNTNITADAEKEYFYGNTSTIVASADFLSDLPNRYLSQLEYNPNNIQNLVDVRNFTQNFPAEDYPDRDTGLWDLVLTLGFNNTSPAFWPYHQRNFEAAGPEGILGILKNNSLDALILPTDFSPGLPAILGTPVVTVPMGFYPSSANVTYNSRRTLVTSGPNIPFGLSFIGPAWSEELLVSLAYAYEQRTFTRERVQPYLVPKSSLLDVKHLEHVLVSSVTISI